MGVGTKVQSCRHRGAKLNKFKVESKVSMHQGAELEKAKVDSTVARRRCAELGDAKVDWKVASIEVQSWTNPKWMALTRRERHQSVKVVVVEWKASISLAAWSRNSR